MLRMRWHFAFAILVLSIVPGGSLVAEQGRGEEPAWTRAADEKPAMTVDEAKRFMRRLTEYVIANHLKTDEASPQRGMIYEYFWVEKKGTPAQWIQGEALDTMHDGAWFACAMANAFRATGDPYYKEILTKWQLPFYLKMLNEGDRLFTSERNDARPDKRDLWTNAKEWRLQGREKGFVPYWWDDGASISLERLVSRQPLPMYPARDELFGEAGTKPTVENSFYPLAGYSLGSSNHKAQDLACMLALSWRVLRDSTDPAEQELARQIALAARNLQECRARHGSASIPIVVASDGLTHGDSTLLKRVPEQTWPVVLRQRNHWQKATRGNSPGQKFPSPGFADDQQYRFYFGLFREGQLTEPVAWRCVYDAYTEPRMFDAYFDDAKRPAGINRFDLYPFSFVDGRPEHVRSERKGPFNGPVPIGSRFGPQNMICCGWALQALNADPKLWMKGLSQADAGEAGLLDKDGRVVSGEAVAAWLRKELAGGLRTWEAIFDTHGYIPTGLGCQSIGNGPRWDAFSDTGGYAHLISAAAQWIHVLEGTRDW